MIDNALELREVIPLEAQALISNMTLNKREINQLLKVNCKKLDPLLINDIKNEALKTFLKAQGACNICELDDAATNKLNVFMDDLSFWCVQAAYKEGYKSALEQYSTIVRKEIVKAAKAGKAINKKPFATPIAKSL